MRWGDIFVTIGLINIAFHLALYALRAGENGWRWLYAFTAVYLCLIMVLIRWDVYALP